MKQRILISRAELERRYIDEGQTQAMIAAAIGCCTATVSNIMNRYNIPARDHRHQRRHIPHEELVQLYCVERVLVKQIAAHFGVTPGTINNRRKEYGIPRRPRKPAQPGP